jgi:hypothetical protein
MPSSFAASNLTIAWIWMLMGFLSGAVMGSFFHREG